MILVGNAVADVMPTVLVVTAIPVERAAMLESMVAVEREDHDAGTIFHVGRLLGSAWRVVLVLAGRGNSQAAVLVERAIQHYRPSLVMMVGVAGGLHTDLELGDVVVAEKVYAVHGGKEGDSGFQAHPACWFLAHVHFQLAQLIASENTWQNALAERSDARAYVRPIASGEVVLDSLNSPYAQLIKKHYNDAAAVEMEGAGVALASHLSESRPAVIVRGISDRADGRKEDADRAGGQQRAARNAVAFALALLAELGPNNRSPRHQLLHGTSDEQIAAVWLLRGSTNPDVVPLLVAGFYATKDHEVSCPIIGTLRDLGTAPARAALEQLKPRYRIERLAIENALAAVREQA
jgi:nucleoside phosphorylase